MGVIPIILSKKLFSCADGANIDYSSQFVLKFCSEKTYKPISSINCGYGGCSLMVERVVVGYNFSDNMRSYVDKIRKTSVRFTPSTLNKRGDKK